MKAKKGFNLHTVCGAQIIVAEGVENIDFSNIISMNESAAYLWNKVQHLADFNEDTLVELLTEEYDTTEDVARRDAHALIGQWSQIGIIE